MRCHDADHRLTAQDAGKFAQPDTSPVQEQLVDRGTVHSSGLPQQHLDNMLQPPLSHMYQPISTYRIMQAVQQQRQITRQLEEIRTQQKARLRILPPLLAFIFSLLGALAVLIVILAFFRPEVLVGILSGMGDVIAGFFVVAQYLRAGLTFITGNSLILSGIALVLVVMMGMWLRLMRYPQT
ncbi:MAG TPA: hypothetical protein VFA09_14300 [Ktedonobacteraceae bacterium]|jgi:hypothetical protein|nr:hypothetical protein [Ktedonobacteraceae bacterium]